MDYRAGIEELSPQQQGIKQAVALMVRKFYEGVDDDMAADKAAGALLMPFRSYARAP